MSTEETEEETSSEPTVSQLSLRVRRTFTLRTKRKLLRKYDLVKDRMPLVQFISKYNIPRRTFRNWLSCRNDIFSKTADTNLSRVHQRKSDLPELDALLYEWFIDFKKRLGDVPISRTLLLNQAHRFKQLLEAPIQSFQSQKSDLTLETPTSDSSDNATGPDFEFTADMYVDNVEQPTRQIEPATVLPTAVYKGITNPCVRCYANAIIQQLFHLTIFSSVIKECPIDKHNRSLSTILLQDIKQLFADLNPLSQKVSSADTGLLLSHMRSPIGEIYTDETQHDAAEFLDHLLTGLDGDLYNQSKQEPFRSILTATYCTQIICPKGHMHETLQANLMLPVSISSSSCLRATMISLTVGEFLDYYYCDTCNTGYRHSALTRTLLGELPNVILLQLERFTSRSGKVIKSTSRYTFPVQNLMDFFPYTKEAITTQEMSFDGEKLYIYLKQKVIQQHYHKSTDTGSTQIQPIVVEDDSEEETESKLHSSAIRPPSFYVHLENALDSLLVTPVTSELRSQSQLPSLSTTTPGLIPELPTHTIHQLVGIVAHSGSAQQGHYTSYIRHPTIPGTFLFLNDRIVKEIKSDELSDNLFGTDNHNLSGRKNMESAYILIYQGKDPNSLRIQLEGNATSSEAGTVYMASNPADTEGSVVESKSSQEIPSSSSASSSASIQPSSTTSRSGDMPQSSTADSELPPGQESLSDPMDSWITRWTRRHNIKLKTVHGEAASCDQATKHDWLENTFTTILRKFKPEDIFNADEAGLFIEQISRKSYCRLEEKPHGGKISKRRVTVLLAASMAGEKWRSVIISSQQYPLGVMKYPIRPYDYFVQQNQWMDLPSFENILEMWNDRLIQLGRTIALIVDGAAVHRTGKIYSNIVLYFLPPSQTAIMQPMDQGIIRSFKSIYRTLVLDFALSKRTKGENGNFRLTTFIRMICRAWARVRSETISNCFRSAGWVDTQRSIKPVKLGLSLGAQDDNHEEKNEKVSTPEELQALAYLHKKLPLLFDSDDGSSVETEKLSEECGVEMEGENEYARIPFERIERSRVLYHLGLDLPYRTKSLPASNSDYLSDFTDDEDDSNSAESLPTELKAIRRYAERLASSSRRDLIFRMVSSIEEDLQSRKVVPPKKLIQTHISLIPHKDHDQ